MAHPLLTEIVTEVTEGRCILLLGAGSSYACESQSGGGVTGTGLAQAIVEELGEDPANFSATLMEASEFIEAHAPQHRKALDEFVYQRLHDLRPTIGHLLLSTLPWKAIITTNYNRAVETGYEVAATKGLTPLSCVPLRTDAELTTASIGSGQIPLYKPHGCLSIRGNAEAPMVLTAKDYYFSTKKRQEIYSRVRSLAGEFSTLFVGYSLVDYNFNNIYYELRESVGDYLARSYTVIPIPSHKEKYLHRVYRRRDIELIDDKFDTFLVSLCEQAGTLDGPLFDVTVEELARPHVVQRIGAYSSHFPDAIKSELNSRGISTP